MEGLMIKRLLKLSPRTRNRDLLYALRIQPVEIKIKKLKINFVKRILENQFTKGIFKGIKTESGLANTFVKEVYELLNIDLENEITNADIKKAEKSLTNRWLLAGSMRGWCMTRFPLKSYILNLFSFVFK